MSAVLQQPPAGPGQELPPAPVGSLMRAELHRFRARRFVQALFGLAVLGWLAVTAISLATFGTPSPAELESAQQQIDRMVAENEQYRQDCLQNPPTDVPPGLPLDEVCGPPVTAQDFDVSMFVSEPPFSFGENTGPGAIGFAFAGAALAFLLGATWIGAEWSSRSLVSLLFWETRRARVMAAKLAVLVLGAVVLAVALQVAWLATASILDATAGDGRSLPDRFWGELLGIQARGVLFTVLAALGGFGLAHLVCNTGAALGIGFLYFAVLETAVRIIRPAWQPALLSDNAAALLLPGGHRVVLYDDVVDRSGMVTTEIREILISNLQGGLVLAGVVGVFVVLGVVLFGRRDVS